MPRQRDPSQNHPGEPDGLWQPRRGPLTRLTAGLILLALASCLILMTMSALGLLE